MLGNKPWSLSTSLKKILSTTIKMESKPFVVLRSSNIKLMLMASHGALTKGEGV